MPRFGQLPQSPGHQIKVDLWLLLQQLQLKLGGTGIVFVASGQFGPPVEQLLCKDALRHARVALLLDECVSILPYRITQLWLNNCRHLCLQAVEFDLVAGSFGFRVDLACPLQAPCDAVFSLLFQGGLISLQN